MVDKDSNFLGLPRHNCKMYTPQFYGEAKVQSPPVVAHSPACPVLRVSLSPLAHLFILASLPKPLHSQVLVPASASRRIQTQDGWKELKKPIESVILWGRASQVDSCRSLFIVFLFVTGSTWCREQGLQWEGWDGKAGGAAHQGSCVQGGSVKCSGHIT